jgi:ABC-type thiamin/hydroxymethylpyrimidine transport system permease subunit
VNALVIDANLSCCLGPLFRDVHCVYNVWLCALVFGLTSRIGIWCFACFMLTMLVREPGRSASWKVIIRLIPFCPDVYFIVCFCIS